MPVTIAGYVFNKARQPVGQVNVSRSGRVVARTADDGSFLVRLTKPEGRVALTFALANHVANTRVISGAVASSGHVVVIWPIAQFIEFDSTRDLDVGFGGSRVRLPANALRGQGGRPFKERARLSFTLFDVTLPFQRAAAPGDYSGRLSDGSVRRLNSFGIFDLSIQDSRGPALELVDGASATLSIAVPSTIRPPIPRRIGFFDFDSMEGLWLQVGSFDFERSSLSFNGTITRFADANGNTQHNLDDPQDTACVTVQILNTWNLVPMANMTVQAQGAQFTFTGTSNASGFVCLLVQKNASFTVSAYGQVGSSNYATPFPPTLTAPNIISGATDCGDPVKCPNVGAVYVDLVVGFARPELASAGYLKGVSN
jgi:hypothetical protein